MVRSIRSRFATDAALISVAAFHPPPYFLFPVFGIKYGNNAVNKWPTFPTDYKYECIYEYYICCTYVRVYV